LQDQFGKVAGAALAQTVPGHSQGAAAKKNTPSKTAKKTASAKTAARPKVAVKQKTAKSVEGQ